MKSVGRFVAANYHDIVDSYRRAGPIVIEVPLGFILFVFGCILLNPQVNVVHTQPGYAGLKLIADSDTFWGVLLCGVGVLKFWVHKPVVWRVVSTSVMGLIYLSLFVNFLINSPAGFVWAFFLFFALLCAVTDAMLLRQLKLQRGV